jgi:hypothetical protein
LLLLRALPPPRNKFFAENLVVSVGDGGGASAGGREEGADFDELDSIRDIGGDGARDEVAAEGF